jgi:hypothetical protein
MISSNFYFRDVDHSMNFTFSRTLCTIGLIISNLALHIKLRTWAAHRWWNNFSFPYSFCSSSILLLKSLTIVLLLMALSKVIANNLSLMFHSWMNLRTSLNIATPVCGVFMKANLTILLCNFQSSSKKWHVMHIYPIVSLDVHMSIIKETRLLLLLRTSRSVFFSLQKLSNNHLK